MDQIAVAHREIGDELGIPVAPVGLAMRRSLKLRPSMAMLGDKTYTTLVTLDRKQSTNIHLPLFNQSINQIRFNAHSQH